MKLLLDDMSNVDVVTVIHTIYNDVDESSSMQYVRRRPFRYCSAALKAYYEYMTTSTQIGYSIMSDVRNPWTYFLYMGDGPVLEKIEISWPIVDWQHELNLLEEL